MILETVYYNREVIVKGGVTCGVQNYATLIIFGFLILAAGTYFV